MRRVFTKRIACNACGHWFTITSAASKFCKDPTCVSQRRKAARLEKKRQEARRAQAVSAGSAQHLARALKSGE